MGDMKEVLNAEILSEFRRNGAVLIRGLLTAEQIAEISAAVEENMTSPGPMSSDYIEQSDSGEVAGRYFGDYCNWQRFKGIEIVAFSSRMAAAASALMQSDSVRFFHEHVLVKEPYTAHCTPWHQDQPYYIAEGKQTVSFWVPLDPVAQIVCPRFVAGSHMWPGLYKPKYFKDGSSYLASETLQEVPDFDNSSSNSEYNFLSWDGILPGDVIAFHFKTMHNAPANATAQRRRVVSLRYLGDDVRWQQRQHRPSPPYPQMMGERALMLRDGDELPPDWFPLLTFDKDLLQR